MRFHCIHNLNVHFKTRKSKHESNDVRRKYPNRIAQFIYYSKLIMVLNNRINLEESV
jgi:hypothetical protein